MAHGKEGPARPPGPEGAPQAPSQGPGPALLRATGAGPAPLGHEPWADSRIECQELTEKAIN